MVKTTVIPTKRQVIYDTYASFPTAGLEKGDIAWATDRKCLYRWSGSAWETIGISSRNGNYADIGDPADYPEGSLYEASDLSRLYMIVSGAWAQVSTEPGLRVWEAGDIVILAADAEAAGNETSYTKRKEIAIASGGIIRVYFEIRKAIGGTCYGKVYKNGVAHGTERSVEDNGYQSFTEDLAFSADDLVQLYTRGSSATGNNYCKNFRLKDSKIHEHAVILD